MDPKCRWPGAIATTLLAASACAHAVPPPAPSSAAALPEAACRVAVAAAAGAATRVPIEVVDGRIYVQAAVNGRGPFRFAVDTGASGMGRADASLVQALDLPAGGQALNSDGVRTAAAATTRLESLELGGLVRRGIEVIQRDYGARLPPEQRFHGIIGREFFADGLLVIDYPGRVLAFTTAPGIAPDAPGSIGYERPFRVPVSIGGATATGHLDTGANVTAVFPASLHRQVAATPLQAAANGKLANGEIGTSRATVAGPVAIGDASLSNLEVRVSAEFPELLIGARLLQRYVLAIDQRTRRVALCAGAGG